MIAVVSGTRPNVFADRFSRERSGLRAEPVVKAAGGELLGGTLYELAPRYEGVPLHIHHGMEELAIVISGRPTLRTLEGESELAPGDIVAFPRGRQGAHTLANRTDAPVRYLMVSNKVMPELVEYPEDGTIRALTRGRFDAPKADEDPADRLNLRSSAQTPRSSNSATPPRDALRCVAWPVGLISAPSTGARCASSGRCDTVRSSAQPAATLPERRSRSQSVLVVQHRRVRNPDDRTLGRLQPCDRLTPRLAARCVQ